MTGRRLSRKFCLGAIGALAVRGSAAAAEAYTMRLALADPATSVLGMAGLRFAAAVGRRSNGQLKVEVYPSGQIATQPESVNALTTGVVDFVLVSTGFLQPLVPQFQVLDMPFMFKNLPSALRVLDGPIGAELFAALEPKGIVGLGYGMNGFKDIETTNKAVTAPEDMKGLRLRIQAGAIFTATYQALGAIPVAIDFSEIFTALSQRVIDGMEINLDGFTSGKYYTIAKYVALSDHIFSVTPLLGSKRKMDALPAPLQKIVREEGKAIVPAWRSALVQHVDDSVRFLEQNGVTFTRIQFAAFRKAVDPVYAMAQSRLGADLLNRVTRAANAR